MASDVSEIPSDSVVTAVAVQPPVRHRELLTVILWTVLADFLIFRTSGYFGPAIFVVLVPVLFFFGCLRRGHGVVWNITSILLILVAARLFWTGSPLTVFSAVALVIALSMVSTGAYPGVLEGFAYLARLLFDGISRVSVYRWPLKSRAKGSGTGTLGSGTGTLLSVVLPALAALIFGSIFVLANPDLLDSVSLRLSRLARNVFQWLEAFSFWELPFCIAALLTGAGLLSPALPLPKIGPQDDRRCDAPATGVRAPLYGAYRNTLITLIVMFSVYLVFEFVTLWRRDFPDGFYYAGYAHQGAAWLTFALAIATAVLSLTISGAMLADDRIVYLRRLAWIWSAQNLFLALAVYNRLIIYVGYNGMTRMRTIGFFGISLVVVGFLLVLYKIATHQSFWWVIRSQLIALMLAVIVYSLFPVDYVAHRYNVAVVRSGYLHPSVMIAVKPKQDEGYLPLLELIDFEDPVIRDGVRALLAERQIAIESQPVVHWTQLQGARGVLLRTMQRNESAWSQYRNPQVRRAAIDAFGDYAMRWY